MNHTTNNRLAPIILFALTLLTSAFLMFIVQPLFGKLLLPLLGGSPSVWNTCMVFYQSILFAGYLYAHAIATRFTLKEQITTHIFVLALSLLFLPIALPNNNLPPTTTDPTIWLLGTLSIAIGSPFFAVSTTAPLIQKWFSQLGHTHSEDPYFLYVASNIGSLLALLSYPFLIEPDIGLGQQQIDWSIAYLILCSLIIACGLFVKYRHNNQPLQVEQSSQDITSPPLALQTKFRWLALAFIPSSLLLGLTNFISTDIASVPLLWIVPLTIYLFSFIVAFSRWNDVALRWLLKLQALFFVIFLIGAFINPADLKYWAYLFLHLIAFFFAVMICHGELAQNRPSTQHLTEFYLIISFAGMLGGMFNTFVAPLIFKGIYEYPVMVIAALAIRPGLKTSQWNTIRQLIPAISLLVIGILLFNKIPHPVDYFEVFAIALICLSVCSYWFRHHVAVYTSLNGTIIVLASVLHSLSSHTLYQERSFFGVLSVRESVLTNEQGQAERYYELFHGTTKHGAQRLSENHQTTPLTYYSRPGPMGQLFADYQQQNSQWIIGAVGLGAGALACYARPEQHWTFYEIDPLVVNVAQNTDYFSYLSRCAPQAKMTIGDARLSLEKEPDSYFDLLILDAFSSDAVPTHLVTKEAMSLYFKKLKPTGILAFHITNRHLTLKKVLSVLSEHLHKSALIEEFSPEQAQPLVVATDWVVMTNDPKILEPLRLSNRGTWQTLPLYFDAKVWTDDFSNILDVWKH